jgi:uncharacterized membrane protein YhhN
MKNRNTLWLIAFALAAGVELWGEASGQRSAILWSKPLLMPLLAVWFAAETDRRRGSLRRQMVTGLVFATVGDVLLMFTDVAQVFFLLGIVFFLFTQLSYMAGFITVVRADSGLIRRRWWLAVPFLAFMVLFLNWLWDSIPHGLRKPLAFYSVAIMLMVLSVINLYGKVARPVFFQLFGGAMLFLISDCLIALHRFTPSFPGANVVIMATYIAGQFLLAYGARNYLCAQPRSATKAAAAAG